MYKPLKIHGNILLSKMSGRVSFTLHRVRSYITRHESSEESHEHSNAEVSMGYLSHGTGSNYWLQRKRLRGESVNDLIEQTIDGHNVVPRSHDEFSSSSLQGDHSRSFGDMRNVEVV